jgi:hypothetical protein
MDSSSGLKLLASALRGVRRHEWMAAGAMLACIAVVLNVSPFARTAKRDVVRTEPSAESAAVAGARSGPSSSERSRLGMEALAISEALRPVINVSAIPDNAFARMSFQPVKPKEHEVDIPAQQDHAATDAAAQPMATIAGIWAPDAGSCSARDFRRDGLLPTIINADGAWAGETSCVFRNQKPTETGLRVVATCSNPRERWTTEVRLTVKDNRLIWASRRGTQVYTRCSPDFRMAAAR